MPVWDKAMFDLAYSSSAEPEGHPNTRPGIVLHYNRYSMLPELQRRADFFISHLGLTTSDRILIVGAGFGWTVEILQERGYNAVGTDISDYIFSSKDTPEDDEIAAAISAVGLDPTQGEGLLHFQRLGGGAGPRCKTTKLLREDSASNPSRNRVKTALGGFPTVAITEDVVTSLTDAECASLHTAIQRYDNTTRVVHFLTELANPNPPFLFNSKTLQQWKAVFPTSTIIADGYTYRVA